MFCVGKNRNVEMTFGDETDGGRGDCYYVYTLLKSFAGGGFVNRYAGSE